MAQKKEEQAKKSGRSDTAQAQSALRENAAGEPREPHDYAARPPAKLRGNDVRPAGKLRALLFDLDGTLSHTDPLHLQAWHKILADSGMNVDADFYRSFITGRTTPQVVRELFPHFDEAAVMEFSERKEEEFRKLAAGMKEVAGVSALFEHARRRGWKKALVTNGSRHSAGFMLESLGIAKDFDAAIYGEELQVAKPDPLPYRLALEAMRVSAEEALAFEDSPPGVRSSVAAGIRTVGVATSQPAETLRAEGASLVITDFRDPALWELLDA